MSKIVYSMMVSLDGAAICPSASVGCNIVSVKWASAIHGTVDEAAQRRRVSGGANRAIPLSPVRPSIYTLNLAGNTPPTSRPTPG